MIDVIPMRMTRHPQRKPGSTVSPNISDDIERAYKKKGVIPEGEFRPLVYGTFAPPE
jgi:hypothetical protein